MQLQNSGCDHIHDRKTHVKTKSSLRCYKLRFVQIVWMVLAEASRHCSDKPTFDFFIGTVGAGKIGFKVKSLQFKMSLVFGVFGIFWGLLQIGKLFPGIAETLKQNTQF